MDNITIWLAIAGAVVGTLGYFIRGRIDDIEKQSDQLITITQLHASKMAVNDDRWRHQDTINIKVDEVQRDVAVIQNQVETINQNIDDIKTSQKEINSKLDVLLQRK